MKRYPLPMRMVSTIAILLLPFTSGAVDPPPDFDDMDPEEEVPIDGGASLLLAAGVGYGIKKVFRTDKKEKK